MKTLSIALLGALLVASLAAGAAAQPGASPAPPGSAPARPADARDPVSPPTASDRKPDAPPAATGPGTTGNVTIERNPTETPGGAADAALPRAAVERTTIFGLSPTAAVIIAAALLVIVILAIVAMTRSGDTYINTDRRM